MKIYGFLSALQFILYKLNFLLIVFYEYFKEIFYISCKVTLSINTKLSNLMDKAHLMTCRALIEDAVRFPEMS